MKKASQNPDPEDPKAKPGFGFPTREQVKKAHWRGACPENDMDFDDIYNRGFDAWLQYEIDKAVIAELEQSTRLRKIYRERWHENESILKQVEQLVSVQRQYDMGLYGKEQKPVAHEETLLQIERVIFPDRPKEGIFR